MRRNEAICELIIKTSIYTDEKDSLLRQPLHHAAIGGFVELCELMLINRVKINRRDVCSRTSLHYSSMYGNAEPHSILSKIVQE